MYDEEITAALKDVFPVPTAVVAIPTISTLEVRAEVTEESGVKSTLILVPLI